MLLLIVRRNCKKAYTRVVSSLYRSKHTGCIYVEPGTLVTDRVTIHGNDFESNSPITVKASVDCPVENISFNSYGHYFTSESGCIDLSLAESVGGTYTGIDSMGLFWSMVNNTANNRFMVTDASIPKTYNFSVFNSHLNPINSSIIPLCSASTERTFLRKNIERSQIKVGNLRGTLFTPFGKGPFPAIITLYGSNKQGKVIEDAAAILANNGFITLALQYYGIEGLPAIYTEEPIKIEVFEDVVNFLLSLENCHSVGIYGTSKGGEIAIAMMSFLPNIKAVASINGYISSIGTSTTYGEHIVQPIGTNMERIKFLPDGLINIVDMINNPEDEPASIHPFEFSSTDLLMVVSLDDYNWNSELSADIAKKRMDAFGKTNYEISKYSGLGHLIDAPYMPICVAAGHSLAPKGMTLYYGGSDKKMHALQQERVWLNVISFFNKTLKSN